MEVGEIATPVCELARNDVDFRFLRREVGGGSKPPPYDCADQSVGCGKLAIDEGRVFL